MSVTESQDSGLTTQPITIVPQRCVIVLPSTGEFDSRAYRIARTLHERGHRVTVVARWKAGLPRNEVHPVGYPIIRVEATAVDGVPLGRFFLRVLRALGMVHSPAAARPDHADSEAGSEPADMTTPGWAHPTGARDRNRLHGYVRRARVFLMIRGHARAVLEVAPAADLFHGMAYMGIPVALRLRKQHGGKVVYDARDIYMVSANLARLPGPIRAVLARLERGWAHGADRIVTVNEPFADEMAKRLDVPKPVIVMNCSFRFTPPAERSRRFHERLRLDPKTRVVLYQGGFIATRGVEQLMEAIQRVNGAVLVLMGHGVLEAEYREAAGRPEYRGRLYVLPAVPPTELLDWVTSADVVGVLPQDASLNNYLATPNKFFEAMCAGVPSVCSDHPGIGPIARATGCGIPVPPDDITSITEAIRTIIDAPATEREAMRARALRAAHETYNWESQVEVLLTEYTRLTGRQW